MSIVPAPGHLAKSITSDCERAALCSSERVQVTDSVTCFPRSDVIVSHGPPLVSPHCIHGPHVRITDLGRAQPRAHSAGTHKWRTPTFGRLIWLTPISPGVGARRLARYAKVARARGAPDTVPPDSSLTHTMLHVDGCTAMTQLALFYVTLLGMVAMVSADAYPYSTTWVPKPSSLPQKSEDKQIGTNACGTGSNQSSMCQNLYINSATDFCLWGGPGPVAQGVGQSEREVVSYCTKSGRGTRLIPDGTLKSVHFVKTPHYVQVSGPGSFDKMFFTNAGGGGELDPHGPDEMGNPRGGLVFSDAFGHGLMQVHEWVRWNSMCLCLPSEQLHG